MKSKNLKVFLITFVFCVLSFVFAPEARAASLSLSPASSIVNVNDLFLVDIILDTSTDSVSGATAILRYDTSKLQVQDDDAATSGVQIKQGTVFNQTPLTNTVDASTGTIRFDSGSLGTSYTGGRGVMATVNFRAVAAGTAQVSFVFSTTTTTDTSLVAAASGPTNLLTTVQDGNYTINTASQAASTPRVVLLDSGTTENTIALLAGGIVLVSLGLIFTKAALHV